MCWCHCSSTCDDIVGDSMAAGKRWVVGQDKVELVTQFVALAFVGSLDVEQDGSVRERAIARETPAIGRPVAAPVNEVRPPGHQGQPPVLVDVPQGVETVQFAPAGLVLEGPFQRDAELCALRGSRRAEPNGTLPAPGCRTAILFLPLKKASNA